MLKTTGDIRIDGRAEGDVRHLLVVICLNRWWRGRATKTLHEAHDAKPLSAEIYVGAASGGPASG
jgi:hypothetical protein